MKNEITIEERYDLFVDTLNKCGMYLLNENDETISYFIYEEFDIGVVSFLHSDNLDTLMQNGYINKNIVSMCNNLRQLVFGLQNTEEWNLENIRNSIKWRNILELSDEIKLLLDNQKYFYFNNSLDRIKKKNDKDLNLIDLERRLDEMKIEKNSYSLNGELKPNALIIYKNYSKWEVFFYEKGSRFNEKIFYSENDACNYLLNYFINNYKYYTYPPTNLSL